MASQSIDLSAGLKPTAPPPSSGGIDLSAGLQTAAAPPAPANLTENAKGEGTYQMQGTGGRAAVPYSKVTTATQHGYQLAGDDADRYTKDAANDPIKQLGELNTGFTHALSETGATGEKVLNHVPILGKLLQQSKGYQASEAADKARVAEPMDTPAKMSGNAIENILEFASGDEALKGLSTADKLAHLTPIAKLMEKSPTFAKMLDAALKQGTVGAAQAAGHGADATHSLEAGAVTGGAAGLITGAAGKIGEMIASRAPATEDIAGEGVQTLSSQRPGTGARGDVTTAEAPKVAAAQQAAAPRVFRNVAQRATQKALDEANVGRAIPGQITDPARMLPAPADAKPYPFTIEGPGVQEDSVPGGNEPRKKQIGTQFVAGKGSGATPNVEPYNEGGFKYGDGEPLPPVNDQEPFTGPTHKEPVFQYLTDLKPGQSAGSTSVTGGGNLVASTPEAAQTHLSRLNELVDHPPAGASPEQLQSITAARDSLQEQMDMYHSYQRTLPNFHPIDSARAAASVGHFGEAEDQLQNAAQPIYQKIDAATDGEFGRLNKLRGAAAKRGDFEAKYDYEDKIDKLITDSGAISPAERAQATRLWSTSKVLGGFNDIIERAANVSDQYAGQVSGGRAISGTKLQNGLKSMIGRYGTDRLESVVGKDGMENMTRMADLLKTQPQSKINAMSMNLYHNLAHGKIGAAIGIGIGSHLSGYEGAAAGALVGAQAERAVLRYVATNPRVGQLFDYAVRNNVTPKVAAGLISAEIQREHPDPEEPQK